jgi:Cys-tRNA(Pro)/Cys-tRNA(Cys) deacylase
MTDTSNTPRERALAALTSSGIDFTITEHGRVKSLEEAAAARGVEPRDIVKSLVVRVSEGNYVFALVAGDRQVSWPKFRKVLGVSRLHMPDAAEALSVTGYERGTITPFGALTEMPVVMDSAVVGRTVSIGAGAHGVAATVDADALIKVLSAQVADIGEFS